MSVASRLEAVVTALCSEATAGRAPGSSQGRAAGDLVAAEFEALGLEPAGEAGYEQPIPAMGGRNLLGAIPGDGPGWIVLGAHYDHLGVGFEPYWGADDNASGVAVMLEVARHAMDSTQGKSVLVSAYDAEEPDWFMTEHMGSQWWVDHPTVPLEDVDLMICLDVVGHRIGPDGAPAAVAETVFVIGADLAPGLTDQVASPPVPGIRPRPMADWVVPPLSDHYAFRERGIPHLFYTCARTAEYHTPEDQPHLLDYDKMAALVRHLSLVLDRARTAAAGSWYFDPGGNDDRATIDTVAALAEGLPDELAPSAMATLLELVPDDRGKLDSADRQRIRTLVLAFEAMLG